MNPLTPLLSLGVTAATLLSNHVLDGSPPVPDREAHAGSVVIILPARNEARNIQGAVTSLLGTAARYGDAQVLVVDDGSTDRTTEIVRALQRAHPRLALLEVDELPEGWYGKPHACWRGAQTPLARRAEWLLFVDADTVSEPALLGRLVAGARDTGADLFTIFPHQRLVTVAERLVMPHIFTAIALGFPWRAVNDPDSPLAIANGQCILVRRAAYDAVGGHAAVRQEIAEDQALAERLKGAGYPLHIADGRDLMTTRMYTSFASLWEGWTKNAYLGLGNRTWLLLLAVGLGFLGGVYPFIAVPRALARREWGRAALWSLALTTVLHNRDRAMREFRVPRWYTLTLPLGIVLCSAIAIGAWFKGASGRGVTWKGRRYATGDASL